MLYFYARVLMRAFLVHQIYLPGTCRFFSRVRIAEITTAVETEESVCTAVWVWEQIENVEGREKSV